MSDERSPYASPESPIEAPPLPAGELAGRGARLGGALIDGLLLMIVYLPVLYFTGILETLAVDQVSLSATLLGLAVLFLSFLAIHGYLLATSGQTVAKKMLGMQIVSVEDNRPLSLGKVLGLRYLPFYVIGLVPVVGELIGFANPLTIFGEERRCLHDYLAGTKVIKLGAPIEPWD